MFEVPIAHVGVVIAYVGNEGKDVTGEQFRHGNLVSKCEKGGLGRAARSGKYPINPYTHKVSNVPCQRRPDWATGKTEAHKLDAIYPPNLRPSGRWVQIHLGRVGRSSISHAVMRPRSSALWGMSALVTQVLEPTSETTSATRRRARTSSTSSRIVRAPGGARNAISAAFEEYNVGAVDTLMGHRAARES